MANARVNHPLNTTNFTIIYLGAFQIAFSYETPIAFYDYNEHGWVVRENDWGPTTGKHLNYINDDKSRRINGIDFEGRLSEHMKKEYA